MKKIILFLFIIVLILIPSVTLAGDIIKEKGDVIVKANDVVNGNIKVGIGNVTVFGKVYGDISVLRGNIILKDKAFVSGNVIAYGGRIIEEGNATVKGRKIELPPRNNLHPSRFRIPKIFLLREGLILKIVIILILLIFSIIFTVLFKKGFNDFILFSKKNLIIAFPIGVITLTLLMHLTPERIVFPFGKIIFILYIGVVYLLILIGMSSVSYLIGDKLLNFLHLSVKDTGLKDFIITIIGGLLLLVLILIPKIGIYVLSITLSLSFGMSFTYLIYKVIKS